MEKVWLNSYPEGVPSEIDPSQYNSLVDLFNESIQKYADKPMYKNMGVTLSFNDVDALSTAFATYLQQHCKLKKGQRLSIMMPNVLQYPIALFGALKAGLIVANVNPLYTARELEHQLKDAQCDTIIILENFAHTLESCKQNTPIKHIITTELGDLFPFIKKHLVNKVVKYVKKMVPDFSLPEAVSFQTAIQLGRKSSFSAVEIGHDDIAFLQYTGGTTGVSKGAVLTHKNMISNMLQAYHWVELIDGKETVVSALPLYHIFALTANCLLFMLVGGCNLLITNPRDIPGFVATMKKERFTAFAGVNTLFNALLNHPEFKSIDFSSLHLSLGGGMAVQEYVAETWRKVTGCPLMEAYGLTEASPAVCINPPDIKAFNGSIGLPIPSTDISIINSDGKHLDIGEVGELCVKGPQVMKGYWNRDQETANIFTTDGWLKTGDIATVDDKGYVRLSSRKKDMIVVSGFNVYPNEIEEIVSQLDEVLECAAVGVPDKKSGERIKLYIVKKDPNLSEAQVQAHCEKNLTNYKRPRIIEFRDSLPKSNVGKILHRLLREESTKVFEKNVKKSS